MADATDNLRLRIELQGFDQATGEVRALKTEIRDVGVTADTAGKQTRHGMDQMSRGFRGMLAAVGIGTVAIGIKDLIEAGTRLQQQQNNLKSALKSVGITGSKAYESIERRIVSSSEHGGFARDVEFQSVTNFVTLTKNANKALIANQAAVNLSRGAGIGWQSAQRYIGQALVGNVKRLQQYVGIIIPAKNAEIQLAAAHRETTAAISNEAKAHRITAAQAQQAQIAASTQYKYAQQNAMYTDRQITAQQVLAMVVGKYGDRIKAYNQSTAGKMNNLKNTFEETAGAIGEKLLPWVNRAVTALTAVVHFMQENQGVVLAFAAAVSFLAGWSGIKLLIQGLQNWARWLGLTSIRNRIFGGETAAVSDALDVQSGAMTRKADATAAATEQLNLFSAAETRAAGATEAATASTLLGEGQQGVLFHGMGPGGSPEAKAAKEAEKMSKGRRFLRGLGKAAGVLGKATVVGAVLYQVASMANSIGPSAAQMTKLTQAMHRPGVSPRLGRHAGGPVPRYFDMGGPVGGDTIPAWLSPGEYVLNSAAASSIGMPTLNAMNTGGGGGLVITPSPISLYLDGRTIARGVVRYVVERAARGPSSLVGGTLAIGHAGPTGTVD